MQKKKIKTESLVAVREREREREREPHFNDKKYTLIQEIEIITNLRKNIIKYINSKVSL